MPLLHDAHKADIEARRGGAFSGACLDDGIELIEDQAGRLKLLLPDLPPELGVRSYWMWKTIPWSLNVLTDGEEGCCRLFVFLF